LAKCAPFVLDFKTAKHKIFAVFIFVEPPSFHFSLKIIEAKEV